jgi:hypothetical protein
MGRLRGLQRNNIKYKGGPVESSANIDGHFKDDKRAYQDITRIRERAVKKPELMSPHF